MSDYYWGTLTLTVSECRRPGPKMNLTEHALIPDVTSTSVQSVLMGTGRGRQRLEISGWASTDDYEILFDDYWAQLSQDIVLADGSTMMGLIESLDGWREKNVDGLFYRIRFVEV